MLKAVRLSIPICFLAGLLYARSAGDLQPLFFYPAAILAGAVVCYLWKTVVQAPLLPYAVRASGLGFVCALYLICSGKFTETPLPVIANAAPIALYACLTFFVLFLIHCLCRRVHSGRKWAATLLALYPASMVIATLAVEDTTGQESTRFRFGAVVEQINVKGISPPFQTYRYHALTRTAEIADLTIQSVYLSIDSPTQTLNTAFLEVVEDDGTIRYAVPHAVHLDNATFVSEGETVDAPLVIITHGKTPYHWDVFYCPL